MGNRIAIGSRTYQDNEILSGNCYIADSLVGDELSIDTLTVTLDGKTVEPLTGVSYGEPVFYYHDDQLIGKFYFESVKRTGKYTYSVSCVSGIGLLAKKPHYGGIYTGQPARELLADIIGSTATYTVSAEAGAVPVYGWLPVATCRDNLRQVLFAIGASIKKGTAGALDIVFLTVTTPTEISDDRLGTGGNIEYPTPVTGVVAVEHGYIATQAVETTTLYDDVVRGAAITSPKGATLNGALVTFSEPVHSLTATGGSILESGVNYAVLASGSHVTLAGKKYVHTTREVFAAVDDAAGAENVARIESATLVSLANSANVAEREASYYSKAKLIDVDMVMGTERPGDAVELSDPFDDRAVGLMTSQDINISRLLLARAKITTGYAPDGGGNTFKHSVVLTGSGTWTVPAGVTRIRAVPIGAGQGGSSGSKGESGKSGTKRTQRHPDGQWTINYLIYPYGSGGAGGKAGEPGEAGKVLEADIDVTPGQRFSYASGRAGTGGTCTDTGPGQGAAGTATTFGSYSSANGSVYGYGYKDLFSDNIYAVPGAGGISGGDGGGVDPNDEFSPIKGPDVVDQDGKVWVSGDPGEDLADDYNKTGNYSTRANSLGGAGGGAAVGAAGPNGQSGSARASSSYVGATSGAGGAGAKPVDRAAKTVYGAGGDAGHGGGGGGGSGAAQTRLRWYNTVTPGVTESIAAGPPGVGGLGGKGGAGGAGCIIIYY